MAHPSHVSTPRSGSHSRSRPREAMNEAWQTTSQQTRRLQVWLKHSIATLSHPETTFEVDTNNANDDNEEEEEDNNEHGHQHDDHTVAVVQNIDEALQAFSHYRGEFPEQTDVECHDHDHDWILVSVVAPYHDHCVFSW